MGVPLGLWLDLVSSFLLPLLPIPDKVSSAPLHSHCWCDLPPLCKWTSEHGPRQKNKPTLQPPDTSSGPLVSLDLLTLIHNLPNPCSKLLRHGLSMPFSSSKISHCLFPPLSIDVTLLLRNLLGACHQGISDTQWVLH